jgi:hypothetical protein
MNGPPPLLSRSLQQIHQQYAWKNIRIFASKLGALLGSVWVDEDEAEDAIIRPGHLVESLILVEDDVDYTLERDDHDYPMLDDMSHKLPRLQSLSCENVFLSTDIVQLLDKFRQLRALDLSFDDGFLLEAVLDMKPRCLQSVTVRISDPSEPIIPPPAPAVPAPAASSSRLQYLGIIAPWPDQHITNFLSLTRANSVYLCFDSGDINALVTSLSVSNTHHLRLSSTPPTTQSTSTNCDVAIASLVNLRSLRLGGPRRIISNNFFYKTCRLLPVLERLTLESNFRYVRDLMPLVNRPGPLKYLTIDLLDKQVLSTTEQISRYGSQSYINDVFGFPEWLSQGDTRYMKYRAKGAGIVLDGMLVEALELDDQQRASTDKIVRLQREIMQRRKRMVRLMHRNVDPLAF